MRVLHYDNRADRTAFDGLQYAWATRFSSVAARLATRHVELLGFYLTGTTKMGRMPTGESPVDNDYRSAFGMVSVIFGRHRLSARYDRFEVDDRDLLREEDPNDEDGNAWTVAYAFRTGEKHRLAVEWLRVASDRRVRSALHLPVRAEESLVQASFRVRF